MSYTSTSMAFNLSEALMHLRHWCDTYDIPPDERPSIVISESLNKHLTLTTGFPVYSRGSIDRIAGIKIHTDRRSGRDRRG